MAWLRSALLGLVCLAVLAADSSATTVCIASDGSAAIETAFDGRCDGCEGWPLFPTQAEARPGSELRDASCQGCLDVDVAGIEQAARRDLELASLSVVSVALVPASVMPLAASPVAAQRRLASLRRAGSSAPARSAILRC